MGSKVETTTITKKTIELSLNEIEKILTKALGLTWENGYEEGSVEFDWDASRFHGVDLFIVTTKTSVEENEMED